MTQPSAYDPSQPADNPPSRQAGTGKVLIVIACSILIGALASTHLPSAAAISAALGVFCIGLWASAAVPEYLPALVFFSLAIILQVAPPQIVLSGFLSSTFWLLFGGMVIGGAIRFTGLGYRMAAGLGWVVGGRYSTALIGVTVFSLALAFVLPSSMGRIVLLIPIVQSLADRGGYDIGSNGRTGMLLAAAFGTCLPAYAILPANTPNMILAGTAESLYGYRIGYWDYLLLHLPVLGLGKAVVLIALILWMFPDKAATDATTSRAERPAWSPQERKLGLLLAGLLLLWLTDAIHLVSPGWIGLGGAILCLWPGSGLTGPNCLNHEVNFGTLFFVAGIMGLGAVIASTGLGEIIVSALAGHADFDTDRPIVNTFIVTGIAALVGAVSNLPGIPAVMTPGAEHLVGLTGLPLGTILMTQVLAFSSVLLPYQAPPLVSAAQVAKLRMGDVSKLCLALFVITVLVLLPLDLLWWYVLGQFPA